MFVRMVNSCLIINMKQVSVFYAENVLKMRKMRKSANYADPHHRILSDALLLCQKLDYSLGPSVRIKIKIN